MDAPETNTQEMNTNPQYAPIICPKCGSREIAFVTEYHKCLGARVFQIILMLLTFIFVGLAIIQEEGIFLIISLVALVGIAVLTIYIVITESKTHVQSICRDCGYLWLLN